MSEPIQTGHRVFQGNRKMNMEMLEMKPFYVATPGSNLTQEEMEAEAMAGVKKPAPPPPPWRAARSGRWGTCGKRALRT